MFTRRHFLRNSVLAGAGLVILRDSKMATAATANDKLNIAAIGVAGQGGSNIDNINKLGQNFVALCDVDHHYAADTFKKFPQAKVYKDFRVMFDEMSPQIDAVLVSTPDHTHTVAAVAAMRHGKHVYCEKPLTRTVREARTMRAVAQETKVVTQMGNQGSANKDVRRAVELVWGGVIGEVREAHVWFDGGNGPLKRPEEQPLVPATLAWDLWLGPAPVRPFNPCYIEGRWRGWRDFGSGIVGDFGCHTANIMFRALRLEQLWNFPAGQKPKQVIVRVEAKPSEIDKEGYPASSKILIELPARGEMPPVKLTLYAGVKPSEELLLGFPRGGWGDLLVGTKGSLYSSDPWNGNYFLLPEKQFENFKGGPPESLPRSLGHHREFVDACKGIGKTFSSFEIGGPLTELLQVANLSTAVQGPVEYDTVSGKILNSSSANQLVHRDYRKGWKI